MRRACEITAAARALAGEMVRPGVTTAQINKAVHDYIVSQGATPTFLNYGGFPASACISVNDVVIHGIPGNRVLKEGDIVSVDVGAMWNGFTGDCAGTFPCGKISPTAQKLIDVTRRSFFEGVKFARQGCRVSDIGHAIQSYVEANGFSVVRSFVGHGVGANLHEEPEVPNFGTPGRGTSRRSASLLLRSEGSDPPSLIRARASNTLPRSFAAKKARPAVRNNRRCA